MTSADGLAIDLQHVTKVYKGRVHALQGIEMRVQKGEIFGLLGPNGAGKSTLVKIIMTVIRPTTALGSVLGFPVGHKPTLRRVGYLPENHRFPRYLTGRQTIEFFAGLAGIGRAERRKRAGELLETVGMAAWANQKVATYSKGMLQRIGLAQALSADPELVVLDEPTDGVDPVGRRDIRDVLTRLRGQGKTVFVNSHLLSELEMICDRVAILVKGKVARQGTVADLTAVRAYYEIELVPAADLRGRVLAALLACGMGFSDSKSINAERTPAQSESTLTGTTLNVGIIDPEAIQPVIDALRAAKLTIRRLQPFRQSLESLFMETVTDPQTGQTVTPGADRPGFASLAGPPPPPLPAPALTIGGPQ